MKETIKTAIANNLIRVMIAGLVGLLTLAFTWCKEPVREVMSLPGQMKEVQSEMKQIKSDMQSNHDLFMNALAKQSKTDSVILDQIVKLQTSDQQLRVEVGTIKSYMAAIKDELPALHKRFNDIEDAVNNTNSLAQSIPFNSIPNE